MLISEPFWKSLSDEDKAILQEAAANPAVENRKIMRASAAEARDLLASEEGGMTISEFTPKVRAEIMQAVAPVTKNLMADDIRALHQEMKSALADLSPRQILQVGPAHRSPAPDPPNPVERSEPMPVLRTAKNLLVALLLFALVVMAFTNIMLRSFFNSGIVVTEELSSIVSSILILILSGAVLALIHQRHIALWRCLSTSCPRAVRRPSCC